MSSRAPAPITQLPGATPVRTFFAGRAAETDSVSGDIRPGLRFLGERDLLAQGVGADGGPGLWSAIELIDQVARECLSSAFSLWAHRMVLEYLARGEPAPQPAGLAERLRSGELVGCTAMAPALRDVAGIEPVPVVARPVTDGLRLDGPIPWASNLFPGAVIVLPVRLPGKGSAVVWVRESDPGVQVGQSPPLLALNATRSSSVRLRDVAVPGDAVLSTDLAGFVGSFRHTFLLLQTAFCTGIASRSLAESEPRAHGVNGELTDELTSLRDRLEGVRDRSWRLARDTRDGTVRDFIQLRLDGAQLAVAATRLEATVRGGAGYVAGSDTSRRLREAAFLPVQAPTEGHLRWELRHSA